MNDLWYYWSHQEWYWSALSLCSLFVVLFAIVCLCFKFFHTIKNPDEDDDHVIIPRDPDPPMIVVFQAQAPPSENDRILKHYDGFVRNNRPLQQDQLQYHSLGVTTGQNHSPGVTAGQRTCQHGDVNQSYMADDQFDRPPPPPYSPDHHQ